MRLNIEALTVKFAFETVGDLHPCNTRFKLVGPWLKKVAVHRSEDGKWDMRAVEPDRNQRD